MSDERRWPPIGRGGQKTPRKGLLLSMGRSKNPITAEQRKLRSQAANLARWSRVPPSQRAAQTQAARDALQAKYERQVDPDGLLPEAERREMARLAQRADLARRALKASRARSLHARQAEAAAEAEADEAGDGAPRSGTPPVGGGVPDESLSGATSCLLSVGPATDTRAGTP
jgi:hypothetical protein